MTDSCTEDGWRRFIALCAAFESPAELEEIFDLFFTHEEKEALGKRYLILKSLMEERRTQREIAEELQVSISKITRGSNALKIISDAIREALKKKMA